MRTFAIIDHSDGRWLSQEIEARRARSDMQRILAAHGKVAAEGPKTPADLRAQFEAAKDKLGDNSLGRTLDVFLGMSAFPDPDAAFGNLWSLLKPGGRAVIVDVFTPKLGFQGRMVNLVARADIRRRSWEPLEARAIDFTRRDLPSLKQHGGTLFLATGTKPR